MKKFLLGLVFAAMTFSVGAREPQEGWKQLGTGLFCDDLISVIDEMFLDSWEVEIEESEAEPGMYRLVNPFGSGKCPYFDFKTFNANDLVINATDPDHVWIPLQSLGFSIASWGSFSLSCFNGLMVASDVFTVEELIEFDCLFGTVADGKITFPDDDSYRLQPSFENYLEGLPADGNTHGKFCVTLPEAYSGIADGIADENAPVEYYNIQGVRVNNPSNGIFIRRQGSKVAKIAL